MEPLTSGQALFLWILGVMTICPVILVCLLEMAPPMPEEMQKADREIEIREHPERVCRLPSCAYALTPSRPAKPGESWARFKWEEESKMKAGKMTASPEEG